MISPFYQIAAGECSGPIVPRADKRIPQKSASNQWFALQTVASDGLLAPFLCNRVKRAETRRKSRPILCLCVQHFQPAGAAAQADGLGALEGVDAVADLDARGQRRSPPVTAPAPPARRRHPPRWRRRKSAGLRPSRRCRQVLPGARRCVPGPSWPRCRRGSPACRQSRCR